MKSELDIIEEVDKMTWIQKQIIYLQYYGRVYVSNYFSYEFCKRGIVIEKPIKQEPVSFEEFCSTEGVVNHEHGDDW